MAELAFRGFPAAAFTWFAELAENNEKAWFEENRATFEAAVREPLQALMADAAERFGGTVKLSRPHRDVRFSKDKSPYRQNLFGVVHSRPDSAAALYASVSAEGVSAGTGYYEMSADQLARYRTALDDGKKAAALRKAMEAVQSVAEVRGRSLKTAPKGVARDHPAVELMRMKEIIAVRRFAPAACRTKKLREEMFATWTAAEPLNGWLDRHVGAAELSERERSRR